MIKILSMLVLVFIVSLLLGATLICQVRDLVDIQRKKKEETEYETREIEILGKVIKFRLKPNFSDSSEKPENALIKYDVFQDILKDLEQSHEELKRLK